MAELENDREEVQDHYEGHEIDIDTAIDHNEIMEGEAVDMLDKLDDDTEVELGPKEPENPNDPYCTC